jgi:hypothetical protein
MVTFLIHLGRLPLLSFYLAKIMAYEVPFSAYEISGNRTLALKATPVCNYPG